MSSLQKLIELTKAITIASRPTLPNGHLGYVWPVVRVEPHYTEGFSCTVDWHDADRAPHPVPTVIRNVSAVNLPAAELDTPSSTGFHTPEDAIDTMYDRMLAAVRGTLDASIAANVKLAALAMHG